MRSITITSIAPFVGTSFRPSCSCSAVKRDGASASTGASKFGAPGRSGVQSSV